MARSKYFVYILGSDRGVLYIGVTNDLERRVYQHREGTPGSFSHRYGTRRLLYFEDYSDIHSALEREKQIKGWRRKRKVDLIRSINPTFEDLLG